MKKYFVVLLCGLMLCGCGKKDQNDSVPPTPTPDVVTKDENPVLNLAEKLPESIKEITLRIETTVDTITIEFKDEEIDDFNDFFYDFVYLNHGSTASKAVRQMVTRIVTEDPQAQERLIELWEAACGEGSLTTLSEYIDEQAELLQQSQELNFKRWPILSEKVHQNYQALGSYDAEVKVLKTYIEGRLSQFDQLIRK